MTEIQPDRHCNTCGLSKPLIEFSGQVVNAVFRYTHCCKACKAAKEKERRKLLAGTEQYKADTKIRCDAYRNRVKSTPEFKERTSKSKRKYREKHKDKILAYKLKYNRERLLKNQLCYLGNRARNSIRCAINRKGFTKKSKTAVLLGCSPEVFMQHLGQKPCEHPHLDHICPVAQAKTEEEVIKLQNYINFQWLTPEENTSKGDKPTEEGIFLCRFLLGREWIYD